MVFCKASCIATFLVLQGSPFRVDAFPTVALIGFYKLSSPGRIRNPDTPIAGREEPSRHPNIYFAKLSPMYHGTQNRGLKNC
jgi:hypothetical protein